MTKYKTIQLLFVVSFFPAWIVRSNLTFYEILLAILLFLIIPFLITFYIFKEKYIQKNYFLYLISLIFVYGLDNHLGLKVGINNFIYNIFDIPQFIDEQFGVYKYFVFPSILLSLFIIIFFLIKISDFRFVKILLIFTLTIALFNLIDSSKVTINL